KKKQMTSGIMPSFYIIIILISFLPLNALALVRFTCKIQEKKPAVIYMSHLACVDLLYPLLLPLKIHYQLNASDWVFGEVVCRVFSAAYYCNMYCSILLMMCMSVDRLLAVVFPIASLTWRSTRKATCVCAGLAAGARWYSATSLSETNIVILVSYSTIIYVLCVKHDHSATSPSSSDNRKRAAIMATAVLTEFVVCFAPSNGFLLYHCVCIAMGSSGLDTYLVYLFAVCLGSASVFLDPLLYYYCSSQYRQQISSLFRAVRQKQ
uniref:Coagulation factor II thrombin receptor n=1 Tax=Cyprinus carpio TaxID=7962 RepID=A0A8C1XSL3_CYPCA